ncbi:Diacylglycerol kinase [hydrothermal vent metagenome]|uniref:Diacylglycerol kinase n=1 Tax=hydrothermal vent metagenome TaxID=652676 RepID=A0A3B0Z8R6_9ZZZZ
MKKQRTGLTRIYYAIGYSWQGFRDAFKFEAAFRQELFIVVLLTPAALYFGKTGIEKALLIAMLGLVIITELLNSAIEAIVDRVGEEHHELSGRAKDIASAAVMFSIIITVVVWILILF